VRTSSALFLVLLLQASPRELIEQLRSDRAEVREKAFDQLKGLGSDAVPDLQRAVQDADPEVSRRASAALRVIAIREVLTPALRKALPGVEDRLAGATDAAFTQVFLEAGEHYDLRTADLNPLVAAALRGARGLEIRSIYFTVVRLKLTAAIPELTRQIRSRDDNLGWLVNDALIRLDPLAAKAAFLQALGDPSEAVQRRCLASLGLMDAPEAVPKIASLLTHDSESIRASAVRALGSLGAVEMVPRLLPLLQDRNLSVQEAASRALGRFATADIAPALLELLKTPNALVHRGPIWVLGRLHVTSAAPELAKELASPDAVARGLAVWALVALQAKEFGPALVPLVEDPQENVRVAAIWAVVQFGLREAGPAIVAALNAKDRDVVRYAAWAAGRMALPDAGPRLLAILKEPDHDAAAVAALALGQLREKAALPRLLELAADGQAVGRNAARAAAMIEDLPPTPQLLALLNSENEDIPRVFRNALRAKPVPELAPEILRLLASEDEATKSRAIRRTGDLHLAEAVPMLRKMLLQPSDPDGLRPKIALSLGALRAGEALPDLVRLANTKPNFDRDAMVTAVGLLDSPEAVAELRRLAKSPDEDLRWAAVRSLAVAGHRDILEDLRSLAKSKDSEIEVAANARLCSFGLAEGVEKLLTEDGLRTPINAVRNPAAWKKLVDVRYTADLEGTTYDIAARIAADAGLRLDWAWDEVWDVVDAFEPRRISVDGAITGADALEQLLQEQRESTAAVLEDGVLRILPAEVEKRVFTRWWRSTQKR
jgi:HEAT repeat protein